MSSLRVSHHNRGLGALPGAGDAARSDLLTADDGTSFAAALGVAGLLPRDTSGSSFGGAMGESPANPGGSRKHGPGQIMFGEVAASLAAQNSSVAFNADALLPQGQSGNRGADLAIQSATAPGLDASAVPSSGPPETLGSPTAAGPAADVRTLAVSAATSAGSISRAPSPVGSSMAATTDGLDAEVIGLSPTPIANAGDAGEITAAVDGSIGGSSGADGRAVVARSTDAAPASAAPMVNKQPAAESPRLVVPHRAVSSPADTSSAAAVAIVDDRVAASVPVVAQVQTDASDTSSAGSTPIDPSALSAIDTSGTDPSPGSVTATTPRAGGQRVTPGSVAQLMQMPPLPGSAPPATSDKGVAAVGDVGVGRFTPLVTTPDTASTAPIVSSTDSGAASATMPNAVSSSNTTEPTTATASVSDQVASHLVRMMSNGSREITVRLRPPELGDLTVRVAVSGRDVSAWFASPQPEVQSAITAAIGQLQTSLGDAGYNLNGAWVGADSSNAQQQGTSQSPLPPIRAQDGALAVGLPTTVAPRAAASGLNIYV